MSSFSGPPPRRRAGGERRDHVLDQVVKVIAERGYDATRFSDVAAASGVAVSTLQFYFGSRDDMLIEALYCSTEREIAALAELTTSVTDPWERIVLLLDAGGLAPLPMTTMRALFEFWHAAACDSELRAHAEALQGRYRRPFLEAIRDGCTQGRFRFGGNLEHVVTAIVTQLDGMITARVLGHTDVDAPGVRAAVHRQVAAVLGMEPGPA